MTLKKRKKHQKFTWIDKTSLMFVKYKTRASVVLKSDFQCFCVCFVCVLSLLILVKRLKSTGFISELYGHV